MILINKHNNIKQPYKAPMYINDRPLIKQILLKAFRTA